MALAAMRAVPPTTQLATLTAGATLFYGFRLALHLLARQLTVPDIAERIKALEERRQVPNGRRRAWLTGE